MGKHAIEQHPVHLGLGASAGTEPRFTGGAGDGASDGSARPSEQRLEEERW